MADRNVWDPSTEAGFIELSQTALAVELHIYIFPNSAKNPETIRADVEEAAKIWCQSKINVQAVYLDKIPPFTAVEPLDLTAGDLAGTLSCSGMTSQVRDQLLSIPRPGNPDLRRSIAVFYIPGTKFQDGGSGCHQYRTQGTDSSPEHFILATDQISGRVLAHEVGHALLVREKSPNVWFNDDPDPERDPNKPIHNTNPQNLMRATVPPDPKISGPQQEVARKSLLVREQPLVFGFRNGTIRKLGVTIKKLSVTRSSDEWTSDDELESSWKLKVSTIRKSDGAVLVGNEKHWNKDPLDWQEYTLDLDYPLLPLTSDADELRIDITGKDRDFWSPDDDIRPIHKVWTKSDPVTGEEVLWGTNSTNIPGGQKGDHVEVVAYSTIDYSVTYNVRQDDGSETRFRTICQ